MLTASLMRQKLLTNHTGAMYLDGCLMDVDSCCYNFFVPANTTSINSYAFEKTRPTLNSVTFCGTNLEALNGAVFSGCSSLSKINVEILYRLKVIGCRAFEECESLSSITIPASVEYINAGAFHGCKNLKNVTFLNNSKLRAVLKNAFSGTRLTSFTFPLNLGQIDTGAFLNTKIKNFTIPNDFKKFLIKDGIIYSRFGTSLVLCPPMINITHFKIPEKISKIENTAMSTRHIQKVTFPSTLVRINGKAFLGCSIVEMDFSKCSKLKCIEEEAFTDCYNLTVLDFIKCVDLLIIAKNTFNSIPLLKELILPPNLHTLSNHSIVNCKNLTTVWINTTGNLTNIGYSAFEIIGIKSIELSINTTNISIGAFQECINLTSFNVHKDNPNLTSVDGVLFANNMTSIIAYPPAINQTSYVIPDSVLRIEAYSFFYSNTLKSIVLPPKLTFIGTHAFTNTNLTEIRTPQTLKTVEQYAFFRNSKLTFIQLNGSYCNIPAFTFFHNHNLTIIHFNTNLEYIEPGAFEGCSNLLCVSCLPSMKDLFYQAGAPWSALSQKSCPAIPHTYDEEIKMFTLG